jgi:hypothetical protein
VTYGFKFLLLQPNGEPHDAAVLVSAIPNWHAGEVITFGAGEQARVINIESTDDPELVEHGIGAIFTVEPLYE